MIVSVPRKRAAAGGGAAALLGITTSYSGSSTSIALIPPVAVTLGQVMYAAFAGEDTSASQSVVSGPSGWSELFRYNGVGGNRQLTVWRKVADAGDVGASFFVWTQSVAFPITRMLAQYAASTPGDIGSGNTLSSGATFDYFPAFGANHPQVVAIAFGDHQANSADGLTQRAHQATQFTGGLRLGLWDTNGPVSSGQQVGIDTTPGGAASTGWVLQSLTI